MESAFLAPVHMNEHKISRKMLYTQRELKELVNLRKKNKICILLFMEDDICLASVYMQKRRIIYE
jgi:hypothetical protein